MTLFDWLNKNGIPQGKFATSVGVSRQALQNLMHQGAQPRLELALAIEKKTGGAVPAKAWLDAKKRKS